MKDCKMSALILNHLHQMKGVLALEKVQSTCDSALHEYKRCMTHLDDTPLEQPLPEHVTALLIHGQELAMERANAISTALGVALNHLPIRSLPAEFQRFHPEYFNTIAKEHMQGFEDAWEKGDIFNSSALSR
jgi:hypothetical protein